MDTEQEIEQYENEYLSAVEAKQYYVELNPNSSHGGTEGTEHTDLRKGNNTCR